MFKRSIDIVLQEAIKISPSILITGARQVGKSTLCLSKEFEYRVFDNLNERESAFTDPIGYISTLPKPIIIDEIQKVPKVLEGIKLDIDKNRTNGNFILTGSANILDMKSARDTLAGRVIEIQMMPLSAKELNHKSDENLIDILFQSDIEQLTTTDISYKDILNSIINGGYPEIQKIDTIRGKALWYNSYISTYVERDIRDVGELRDINSFIKFFNIIASRSCGLINKSNLANDSSLSEATVNNYISMLDMIYQISLLKPYSSNISKRFIKSSKLFMLDSGVLSHLLNITTVDEMISSNKKGEIVETFVYAELLKHISYSLTIPNIYHYRTNDKKEIDFIIEKGDKILAIDVKSSQTIKKDAFKHIINFQEKSSSNIIGIVFYG
ncbi:MAG: ATP-binding protein, partial [Campylobacterota bacterium]|nr:ATP-binding protein [Campylobacterota bacterium]